jgi:cobalt-zinc-cadmium efflux system membrane fusion protein
MGPRLRGFLIFAGVGGASLLAVRLGHMARAGEVASAVPVSAEKPGETTLTEEQERALDVKCKVVRAKRGDHPLQTGGKVSLDLDHTVRVRTLVTSVLTEVCKHPGELVAKDDPLFVLESTDLGDARNAYRTARAMLEVAAKTYAREASLRAKRATTESDFLAAFAGFRTASITAEAALQKCLLLGVSPQDLDTLEERCEGAADADAAEKEIARVLGRGARAADGRRGARYTIRAPIDGVLISRDVARGELVDPSQVLATISDLSHVWVQADIYPRDLARVRAGAAVEVTTPSYPDTAAVGSISYLADVFDDTTHAIRARVAVPNDGRLLKNGMAAKVLIHCPDDTEKLEVPPGAIVREGEKPYVIVRTAPGRYARRSVKLGLEARDAVHVDDGLAPGDEVVVGGNVFIHAKIPFGD